MNKYIFKDSNEYEAKDLFNTRESFKKNAYSNFKEKYQVILNDQLFEKPFFGRIDSNNHSIFTSEKFLKELSPKLKSFMYVQDFVKDAFGDLDEYYKKGLATKKIKTSGSPYAGLVPRKTFISVHKQYSDYVNKFTNILVPYIRRTYLSKEILGIEDFIDAFLNFLKEQPGEVIFTRSKYISSSLCNPMISGLSISLTMDDHSNDLAKYNLYLQDSNFPFFLESCRRHCFVVDKNAPWMIHFDFNSPYAKKYLDRYNLKNLDAVLESRFYKAYYSDIQIIKSFLVHAYAVYISAENVASFVVDIDGCNHPIIQKTTREVVSIDTLQTGRYNDLYWIKKYLDIRLLEESLELNSATYKQLLLDVQQILRYGSRNGGQDHYGSALTYLVSFIEDKKKTNNSTKTY
jgi:hypothetical protein